MAEYLKEEDLLAELQKCKEDKNHSKEVLGGMFILIASNMTRMPCFSGYSDLWKADMVSNAVLRCLLYFRNFDSSMVSKRTNKPVKAFAYFTEICFKSFVEVLNQKKRNEKIMERSIEISELDDMIKDYGRKLLVKKYDEEEKEEPSYHIQIVKSFDEITIPEKKDKNTLVILLKDTPVTIELFEQIKKINPFENLILQEYSDEKYEYYTTAKKKTKDTFKLSEEEILKELGIETIDSWMDDE